jgi:hypothetical protein
MPRWRHGHQQPCRLVARVSYIVRHAGRYEDIRSAGSRHDSVADLPLAGAVEDVEGLLLNAMDMQPGCEARRHHPVEHAGMARLAGGHQNRQGMPGHHELRRRARQVDQRCVVHRCPSSSCGVLSWRRAVPQRTIGPPRQS